MPEGGLSLREFQPKRLTQDAIPREIGEAIWRKCRGKVAVEFPTPKTDGQWELTAQGWVGQIPITEAFYLRLEPKVPLGNLFRMLEYAYRLQSFQLLEGLIDCGSLAEFYERLANILCKRILNRARKGFYHAYVPQAERLPFVRGRLDVRRLHASVWSVALRCHYQEHTGDVEENQLLAWTTFTIMRSGLCSNRVLPTARHAFHALRGVTSLQPKTGQACLGRLYSRLNDDYEPMHALCRFFLEHSGPSVRAGDRRMLPFLVDMARLYELFVAEWLNAHLPANWLLKAQEKVSISQGKGLHFDIDLVLYDSVTGRARCVLDTKYKPSASPDPADIAQVVAYAEAKGCAEAILIYPSELPAPLKEKIGRIEVRALPFSIGRELEEAGERFLASLLPDTC